MKALTEKQSSVLDFIGATLDERGYPPSSREIQEHFGLASQTSAMQYLRSLQRAGRITDGVGGIKPYSILPDATGLHKTQNNSHQE